jgi:hypothetical protein
MLRAVLGILLMLKLVATIETLYRPEQEITLIVHDLDSRKTHLRFAYSYIPLCPIKRQYDLLTQQLPYNVHTTRHTDKNNGISYLQTSMYCTPFRIRLLTVAKHACSLQKHQSLIRKTSELRLGLSDWLATRQNLLPNQQPDRAGFLLSKSQR